ncbi:di-heme enzyme [Nannocystis sp. RBIL2]|uniref:methanobactin export MATE transporter MbnM n=1 Tax=Nannocystis sp. RBIL2 TaxID=2996788 RepID=UPI0022720BF5|nr:di-heme enzyme [Nannocystis sp. RBIL2]
MRRVVAVCFAMLLGACPEDQAPDEAPWEWQLPPGFPEPFVPEDDPMSAAKVELGRHIFYDERLSYNETMACATCHEQARAFTDGKATPIGSTGHALPRNVMSLTNVAFQSIYTWANPKLSTLEEQALVPMFADFPLELGVQQDTDAIVRRFADDPEYQELFAAAWPADDDPFTVERVVQALASFQRTLISGDSAYDRFIYGGDSTAMSESAQRGMALFFSETGECYHCHAGANFSTSFRSAGTEPGPPDFQNNGLYNLDDAGAYPPGNGGLYEFTGDPRDQGKFRVPTLRNIAVTAPYMHDGSMATLAEVIDHYAAGGRQTADGPLAGDGRQNPNKSPLVRQVELSPQDRADLVAFLESLTDEAFLTDPKFGPP